MQLTHQTKRVKFNDESKDPEDEKVFDMTSFRDVMDKMRRVSTLKAASHKKALEDGATNLDISADISATNIQ